MSTPVLAPARSIVVAPRLPDPPKERTGNPWTSDGDVVVDCEACGYHAWGPRAEVKKALDLHKRLHHASSSEPLVVLINQPRL